MAGFRPGRACGKALLTAPLLVSRDRPCAGSHYGGPLVAARKLFRIEKMMGRTLPEADEAPAMEKAAPAEPVPAVTAAAAAEGPDLAELAALRDRVAEAARLQSEIAELSAAIERTKRELSALHYDGSNTGRFNEVGTELDAVINATEQATETILSAAERIETAAGNLSAQATDETGRGQADEIAEQVVGIFEACNFQDITGQRITKVVSALQFIDERVQRMMEIWGGPEDLAAFIPEKDEQPADDESELLNGPALEEAVGHATQDDIDALFA